MPHLLQINKTSSFQNSIAIEVGLSDSHLMILTVLKSGFVKEVQGSLCTVTTANLIL